MKTKQLMFVLVMLLLGGVNSASAAFKDIKIDLTNGNFLQEEEMPSPNSPSLSFGVAIGDDGSQTRVTADDVAANIVLNGKYHSKEHGWGNFSATVKVEGPVKITMGSCAWGGAVTVKDEGGNVVAAFNTNNGVCYHNDKVNNVVSAYYKGNEATRLTISGGSYTPYIAVEAVDAAEIPNDVKITYKLGDVQADGIVPAEETVEAGASYKIPANYTLYVEGKTLTAWTDGTDRYTPGQEITLEKDLELTPVFTDNTVSLADRTEPVTVKWNFCRSQGAPLISYEGKDGFLVAQANVGDNIVDVKMPFSTSPGKLNNTSNEDWIQCNNGTTFTVQSCKGAIVSMESYNPLGATGKTATTIDGQSDYTSGKSISYTVAGTNETVDIIIGNDAGYLRYVQVELPVVEHSFVGKIFAEETGDVTWTVGNENDAVISSNITGAVSSASVSTGSGLKVETATYFDEQMMKYTPSTSNSGNVEGVMIEYRVKAAKGLTFKPVNVSYDAVKVGTNGATFSTSYTVDEVESTISDVDASTVLRNDNSNASTAQLRHSENISADAAEVFTFRFYISKTANDKNIAIGNVVISGVFNGTVEEATYYSLAVAASPEAGGEITIYPNAKEYESGSEVQLTATQNFGYHFVNWTDAAGNEVSTEAKFKYTVDADAELTANFEKVNTYELTYNVDGGANIYMVQPTPEPTVVDGKNMYEEGTVVTLTASNNKILTFTNWSDGTSNSELELKMTENKTVTAYYSVDEYIAGWDFYKAGNNGRKADFAAQDNDADAFNLVNEETGETSGWLDKSQEAAGGDEGKPAARNWRAGEKGGDVGHYYWQTMVNASAFTDIKVSFEMMYNFNAYTTYLVAYSTDGENWSEPVGSVTMEGAKDWTPCEVSLPAEANNQEKLYIRWYADKTSEIRGTSSKNDGNAITNVFILGTENAVPDPVAPALVSTVPAEGAENASATGKIVLTFDKRVKVSDDAIATLNDITVEPAVFGKTVTFQYKNLDYATDYVFTLPANSVMNQTGTAYDKAITIKFKTMQKPKVEKALYDFIVPDDGAFEEALAAADKRADQSKRFRIFVKQGTYTLPQSNTATISCDNGNTYPSPMTNINSSNISIIGEDIDATVVTNTITDDTFSDEYGLKSVYEGIGKSDVLQIQGSVSGLYFQDLTVKSGIGDELGRNIAVQDKGTKTIYKNVCLYGYQDTWVSNANSGLYYFEGGNVRGRTDFLCGKGDAFFNAVDIVMCDKGGYIAVPSQSLKYGYVFKDCTIMGEKDGIDGNYTLGRPWGSGTPVALYIDTKMEVQPSDIGWNEMSGGWPKRFAEYNSMTSTGTVIDLNGRKSSFNAYETKEENGETVKINERKELNNPILTEEEAAEAGDMSNMYGDWQPTLLTEQVSAPANVLINGSSLTWDDSNYVLCWAVCKEGKVVGFTTEPEYTVDDTTAEWSVRAANEMGGLGEATVAGDATGISEVDVETGDVVGTAYYNLQGIRVGSGYTGVVIKVDKMKDGRQVSTKIVR